MDKNIPKATRTRATQLEMDTRIDQVVSLLTKSFTDSSIKKNLIAQGLSSKTASRAIEKAKERISNKGRQSQDYQNGLLLTRLDQQYNEVSSGEGKNPKHGLDLLKLSEKVLRPVKKQGHKEYVPSQPTPPADPIFSHLDEIFQETRDDEGIEGP
ncbi:MAG: hypothetical protein K2X66_00390 [Cyanobacteria bacterium]|nr:hypothetical protein [Cyanobacteriota bacterium]